MTQEERRSYLIKELLLERPEYAGLEIPAEEEAQKRLLRSLFNLREPLPVSEGCEHCGSRLICNGCSDCGRCRE